VCERGEMAYARARRRERQRSTLVFHGSWQLYKWVSDPRSSSINRSDPSINRSDPSSRTRERVESERPRAWNEEGLFNAEAVHEMDSERLRATLARVHTRVPLGSF